MFPPGIFGTPAQPPSAETRYLRDDLGKQLKREQRELWERHYPVGQLLPAYGRGMTISELKSQVAWYCQLVKIKHVAGVDEIIEELIEHDLVKEVK